jgi:16S rRNA (guanine966-N2)-methyltransferase
MRQALFDMLMHAEWARGHVVGAVVLDAFAGTGALGLEALSRGAAQAIFIERDRAALVALRANIAVCRAEQVAQVLACDVLRARPGPACNLVFLDPPYGKDLVAPAVAALRQGGWLAADAILVVETGRDETLELGLALLAERNHAAARVTIWQAG